MGVRSAAEEREMGILELTETIREGGRSEKRESLESCPLEIFWIGHLI